MTRADYARLHAEEMQPMNPTGCNAATWRELAKLMVAFECIRCQRAYVGVPKITLVLRKSGDVICTCRDCLREINQSKYPAPEAFPCT